MVFRLPTHLESFIPPPSQQASHQRPWRGALIVSGMRTSDRSSNQTIHVTAVETDGDNRADLWPPQFFTHITHGRPLLKDFQAWVKRHAPPLCTFMPDRHRDPNINAVNQTTFRSLSRILFETETVAIASWGSENIPGAGIIIFPAQNSSSLLVGALFLTDAFPAFVIGTSSPPMPLSPAQMQPGYNVQYQQPIMPYATSSRHHHSISPHQVMPYSTTPIDESGSQHRQPQYAYPLPHTYSATRTSLPTDNPWPEIKDEEEGNYTTFPPHSNPHYPRSG